MATSWPSATPRSASRQEADQAPGGFADAVALLNPVTPDAAADVARALERHVRRRRCRRGVRSGRRARCQRRHAALRHHLHADGHHRRPAGCCPHLEPVHPAGTLTFAAGKTIPQGWGLAASDPNVLTHDSFAEPITARTLSQESWNARVAFGRPGRAMTEHAVVIAGGGPTGMMLAGELALAGIDVVIVERRASQELDGSRAGGLHSRTIEVLDQRGIAERFLSAGQEHADPGLRRDPVGHQRLPHPPQLRARALAEPLRAHPGRLGRRARGPDPSWLRGGGLRAGRHRRRRRAVRRHVAPGGVPRRVRRRAQRDPQGGRHRLPRIGSRRPAG